MALGRLLFGKKKSRTEVARMEVGRFVSLSLFDGESWEDSGAGRIARVFPRTFRQEYSAVSMDHINQSSVLLAQRRQAH